MFALIRNDDINLALFVHVLGALLLIGTLFTVALASGLSWRRTADNISLNRLAFKTVLYGVFPSYLIMRVGAQWVEVEEGLDKVEDVPWITIGYITADAGMLLVLISMILAGVGLRKVRTGNGLGASKAVGIISALLVVASLVAVWAMVTKPV